MVLKNILENTKKDYKRITKVNLFCFLWAIFAHGSALFNKYSYHDDAFIFWIGETYSVGRWALGDLGEIVKLFTGTGFYSLPLFNGILTVFFITVMVYLIIRKYNIHNIFTIILVSGLLIAFPTITGIFGFMFTAPYYYFGTLIGVIGILTFLCDNKPLYFIIGGLLVSFSVGVYQANIPFLLAFLLLDFILKTIENDFTWKEYFLDGLRNIFFCIYFMADYFIFNKIALLRTGTVLLDYRDINNFGFSSATAYIGRLITAYAEFIIPADKVSRNMYPFNIRYFYYLFLVCGFALLTCILLRSIKENKRKAFQLIILFVLIPLATNFIYIMVDLKEVHGLMMYGETMIFIISLILSEKYFNRENNGLSLLLVNKSLLLVIVLFYCWFANLCYLKANYVQAQGISYYNNLINRITNIEGYDDDYPVIYIGSLYKKDNAFNQLPEFDEIYLHPYRYSSLIDGDKWDYFMKIWCGYAPKEGKLDDIKPHLNEVKQMPCYPDDGSIRIIDDRIVVKFADIYE